MPALFQDDGDDDLPGPGDLELGDGEGSLEVEDQPEDKGPIGAVQGSFKSGCRCKLSVHLRPESLGAL